MNGPSFTNLDPIMLLIMMNCSCLDLCIVHEREFSWEINGAREITQEMFDPLIKRLHG